MNQIPLFKVFMDKTAIEESNKVLSSGYVTQGPVVENFENKLKVSSMKIWLQQLIQQLPHYIL